MRRPWQIADVATARQHITGERIQWRGDGVAPADRVLAMVLRTRLCRRGGASHCAGACPS
ncbi:hypothetical protein RSK60_980014 [Ralstonia solanacearum K60]|nr:hypothetical protein RSK60_980014 [Ralstonia solanacearum K60]